MPEPTEKNTMDLADFNLLGTLAQARQFAYKCKFEYLNFGDNKGLHRISERDRFEDPVRDRARNPYFTEFRIYPKKKE